MMQLLLRAQLRFSLLILVCFATHSLSADEYTEMKAMMNKVIDLMSAAKHSEAEPLARKLVRTMEQKLVDANDQTTVAMSVDLLAQIYFHQKNTKNPPTCIVEYWQFVRST